ncbi:chaperone [Lithospermum erythrorhizon]|uniref:Chaperone n=1 Tax=Lithospermum erythrorhizon TaxID=34254 RepID=A0AAV3P3W7_LITER
MFEHITANEIAGYTVGALLVCATISAPKIDSFISVSQRRSLNMCTRCGNLKVVSCTKCKGSGAIKEEAFTFNLVDESYQSSSRPKSQSICMKCKGTGRFRCRECFKSP